MIKGLLFSAMTVNDGGTNVQLFLLWSARDRATSIFGHESGRKEDNK